LGDSLKLGSSGPHHPNLSSPWDDVFTYYLHPSSFSVLIVSEEKKALIPLSQFTKHISWSTILTDRPHFLRVLLHTIQYHTIQMSNPTPTPPPPTSSSSTTSFPFPREYSFPPFFTRQTNLTTHHAQLVKWAALVLAYCRHYRIFKLALSGTGTVATTTTSITTAGGDQQQQQRDTTELFHNRRINRRLSLADIREVINFLRKDGRAEYVNGGGGGGGDDGGGGGGIGGGWETGGAGVGGGGDLVWIYWRTPEEWAALVEAWVEATGQRGSVMTLYELVEGDATLGEGELYPLHYHHLSVLFDGLCFLMGPFGEKVLTSGL
jgi:ESCRT-II complex subunit VPS25